MFTVQLLAEYTGSELRCVTPHTADGETVTVMDRLTMLEGEEELALSSLERASAARPPAQSDLPAADTVDEDSDPPLPEYTSVARVQYTYLVRRRIRTDMSDGHGNASRRARTVGRRGSTVEDVAYEIGPGSVTTRSPALSTANLSTNTRR